VIGHGDWTVKHFRFDGLDPTVVYDWDRCGWRNTPSFFSNAGRRCAR
jgi:hypothetical protein